MTIVICDDELLCARRTETLLCHYLDQEGMTAEVILCRNREELLSLEVTPSIAFMDIELGEQEDGIALAGEVNDVWPQCRIVFLTAHINFATEVYDTKHIYFVLKDDFEKKIGRVFHRIEQDIIESERKLCLHQAGVGEIFIRMEELLYFERNLRITRCHTKQGIYEIRENMSELESLLKGYPFVRVHNSFIVSIPAIRIRHQDKLILEDGTEINISYRYRKKAQQRVEAWVLEQSFPADISDKTEK